MEFKEFYQKYRNMCESYKNCKGCPRDYKGCLGFGVELDELDELEKRRRAMEQRTPSTGKMKERDK